MRSLSTREGGKHHGVHASGEGRRPIELRSRAGGGLDAPGFQVDDADGLAGLALGFNCLVQMHLARRQDHRHQGAALGLDDQGLLAEAGVILEVEVDLFCRDHPVREGADHLRKNSKHGPLLAVF
jgi:hypothetical protein